MMARAVAPRSIGGHGAPREIPVVLLARRAVDGKHHGKGLGALLLKSAVAAAAAAAQNVGVGAVMVRAIDEPAARSYRHRGFRTTKNDDLTLFLTRGELDMSMRAMTSGR
jgi:GNAT superfamily N-acetyltransferase